MGNQCSFWRTGEICSYLDVPDTILAAAFWAYWSLSKWHDDIYCTEGHYQYPVGIKQKHVTQVRDRCLLLVQFWHTSSFLVCLHTDPWRWWTTALPKLRYPGISLIPVFAHKPSAIIIGKRIKKDELSCHTSGVWKQKFHGNDIQTTSWILCSGICRILD